MSLFSSLLPTAPGLLPKWQLLVSGMAFLNSAQNLFTLKLTRRIYGSAPSEGRIFTSSATKWPILISRLGTVTALQARTFAVWTFVAAIIRFYCAYHIHEKTVYDITLWSYVAALAHFGSEWFLFRTAKFGMGLLGPTIIAPVSILWMLQQYDYYVAI